MDMLQVRENLIVDAQGTPVRLRGTAVGGWMNMEHFINGYPGAEEGLRTVMADVLGPNMAHFFFERLLDYFFAEQDVAFIRKCGANVVRLALNYRHFERDDAPFEYVEAGFERLKRVIGWCARYGLYVILDLHAVQGWQNPDWHSDNPSGQALFWQHRHFQDRFVALWEELAHRFRGNPTVAGYNVMNEPICGALHRRYSGQYEPDWDAINQVYSRVVQAIRLVDPQHIVFLEGDNYSRRFAGLDAPFAENLVYSSHNYNVAGFGSGPYPGTINDQHWDRDRQVQDLREHEGTRYARQHNVPLWVGEFGSAYNGLPQEKPDRLRALDDQIDVFEEAGIHWTTWTYKDVGVMGWVQLHPECAYLQLLKPVLEAKTRLATDSWGNWLPTTPTQEAMAQLSRLIERTIGDPDIDPQTNQRLLSRAALAQHVGSLMQPAYAKRFRGLSENEIDRVLQSFALENCRVEQGLIEIVAKRGKPG
jgi:endoglucanase